MVATSFAPFAVLQDALITTRISCVPTNLTATAKSPVLTCFPFNVAFAAEMVTLQVTASSSPSPSRSSSRDPSHSVCPPFHNTHHNTHRYFTKMIKYICNQLRFPCSPTPYKYTYSTGIYCSWVKLLYLNIHTFT